MLKGEYPCPKWTYLVEVFVVRWILERDPKLVFLVKPFERIAFAIVPVEVRYPDRAYGPFGGETSAHVLDCPCPGMVLTVCE